MSQRTALSDALRTGPFHHALRTAVAARGLALERVRHRLAQRGVRVSVASLSYWQSGIRRPERAESLRAVRALEDVLELPAHSLSRLLVPRTAVDRPPARSYQYLMEPAAALAGLLAELDSPPDGGLHTVVHYERVRIGPARELLAHDSQHVVRAHRDGVDRYVAIHHGDPGCDVERVRVRAADNCRVGRVRRDQGSGVVVAELLFDGRLGGGDTALLGYGFDDGSGPPSGEYVRGFPFGGGQYVLQAAFAPTALPVRCRRFEQPTQGAPQQAVAELVLNGRGTAHFVEEAVRPGLLGIAWDWS
ncbi:hypothetical protein ABZ721_25100 [Streptomyces sp. NPDC006733]|uniref:hypothetical protein n=1 Tax=Streptomyces sp. NPDC006733 TaxID=3155460 RepID=UPI0033EE0DBA